ncbi:cell wall anchor protein, partial [Rodentibacter caecimuris]
MSTTLKVLSAKKVIASHQITQGEMLVIEARDKSNYQLIDNQTGLGPQNIIAKREGKDLKLFLEDGDMSADVVIKGYYGDENSEEVSNLIVGQHENGGIYAYVPESGLKSDAVSMLAEEVAAPQALGGEDLASAFWAFNPWWLLALVPLAAGIAIAASNGGSSGGGNENTDNTADKPTLDAKTDGSVTVKPGADNTKVVVKYTDENGNEKTATLTKDANGNWTSDNPDVAPKGDGSFTIPADKVKDGSKVTAIGTDDKGNTADADATTAGNNPDTTADKPTLTPETDGSVSVKPGEDNTKVVVKYTDEDGTEKTATLTKDADGNWTSDNPDVTPKNDGTFTIPTDKVKDSSEVTAIGTDDKGNAADADATTAGNNPDTTADKPTLTPETDGSVSVKP